MGIKTLIVGGVAGGASAAARLRRMNEDAEIILFEKGKYISFANCGLPYYIGEVITEKEKLVVQTPESFKKRFNIDVRINSEVVKIITDKKNVEVYDKKNTVSYFESYDTLILSPGAEPIKPPLPGIDSPVIFTVRNIPDTYRIKDFVDIQKPRRAVVVGAGFIGLEVAENLHRRGVKVTVVELADHVIGPLDYDMASLVHQHMKSKNVEFYLKDAVKSFTPSGKTITVELTSGKMLKTDMVILGIGVRPESKLARDAGLSIGVTGGIAVNEYMQTSNPDIYAVGDAVEVTDFISKAPALIPLAGPANKQGRIVANNICGRHEHYNGTQGTSIVKVFDITVAITGSNERVLTKNNIAFEKSFTHSPSHAGYYPGAIPMSIKLMFAPESGKVLGAQIVGYDGVDKRIDVIATAIRAGMTIFDLETLELAYAPPYSSAKDPVNIAGYTAANIVEKTCAVFHWNEASGLDTNAISLVDVRTPMEYSLGTIGTAINIPVDELRNRLGELPQDKPVYVFCQVGLRGYVAARILMQHGFATVKNLSGGYKTYELAIQEQANEDIYEYDTITKDDDMKSAACNDTHSCNGGADVEVDACGLQCPGPIMKLFTAVKAMNYGETARIRATDPAFYADIKAWSAKTGNTLVSITDNAGQFCAVIRKEREKEQLATAGAVRTDKTMVVFSNDLDKAIATFIIANGAAAMGRKVTLFFTFWGLNILRRPEPVKVKKDFLATMFGFMMPRGSKKLSLSQMNMGGMGALLIRYLMKKKNVASLEELIAQAIQNGVLLVACNMSMDIMGIKKEELIDGVTIGGVATFLAAGEDSNMSLFI